MVPTPAQIIVQLDGKVIQTVELTTEVLVIGRTPDNGLSLPHPLVSRRHAELRVVVDGVMLTDLDSSNGTFVDGTRLLAHRPQHLSDGAVIQIAAFMLVYQAATVQPREEPLDITALEGVSRGVSQVVALPPARRERLPLPLPQKPASRYLYDMPIIYHDNEFLGRYLMIFEALWEPLEQRQDHIDTYFDPRTCPESFLPWIAKWFDFSLNPQWPEPRRRQVVSEAMELYRWRGTRYGLTRLIELCTGVTPEIVDDPIQPFVLRIRMTIPPESGVDRSLIESLVRTHKPAHVGYILELQP